MSDSLQAGIIQCQEISFGYDRNVVLDHFSHSFGQGITLIKGYSGCGKSTLLKLIAGYLQPRSGKVLLPEPWGKPSKRFRVEDIACLTSKKGIWNPWNKRFPERPSKQKLNSVEYWIGTGRQKLYASAWSEKTATMFQSRLNLSKM